MEKINVQEFIESLKQMSVLELNELVKAIEAEFGVTAAAVAVQGAAPAQAVEEGPKSYKVVLANFGATKLTVIKVIKEMLGVDLKKAKDIVDGVPSVLKEEVNEEEANQMKAKLEEAGAVVELK